VKAAPAFVQGQHVTGLNTRLKEIDVPESDIGAPMPVVLAEENLLLFGYYLPGAPRDRKSDACVIVSVELYRAVRFGYPNDEALSGHRYAAIGLLAYRAYEVLDSEWIRELKLANRSHPNHSDRTFEHDRHFIFTFHDSVLEFISDDELTFVETRGDLRDLIYSEARRRAA
jgi:hypothetical protein